MKGKKKLKVVLIGVVILINIAVMGVVLSNPNEDTFSKFKEEIEKSLAENSGTNEEESEETLKDNEDIREDSLDSSNNSENTNSSLENMSHNNSNSSDNSNSRNDSSSSSNNSENINSNSNLYNTNDKNSGSTDNAISNTNNNAYQDTVTPPKKDYLNGMESTAYIQEKLDEKYSENGGVYLNNGSMIAYGLDGSLKTKEGHTIFYWGYFLNDEKPPYHGLNSLNDLYRVVTLNSVTKEITDFGYKNGRTYEELSFRTGPKRD